jgi:hypothetical protein
VADEGFIAEDGSDLVCKPTTCEALGLNCGFVGNGCGEAMDCGQCPEGQLCGGEVANVCLAPPPCNAATGCGELGWECGIAVDDCGNTFDCAAEGLACGELETCIGGVDGPAVCQTAIGGEDGCDVCDAVPDCETAAQLTTLTGRVITPGREDINTGNQVGVPNAFVYVLTNNDPALLPAFVDGIPADGEACDRCDGQDLGPVLVGATTDALGNFTLEGNIPVGKEFLLVTKVGRFRRATPITLADTAACTTTPLDPLETRLPRGMADGVGVNIPRIAISTGDIDAMECVFEKMGVAHDEFNVAGDGTNPERVHLYGTDGAEMPAGNPEEDTLHADAARLLSYDMVVFDCQGGGYLNPPAVLDLDNVLNYVNRGGRMFASHLSFQWICRNGEVAYDAADPHATGMAPAADFPGCTTNQAQGDQTGVGLVSVGRPQANPEKIQDFSAWLVNEGAAAMNTDGLYEFTITQPRDLAQSVGTSTEEFVYRGADAEPMMAVGGAGDPMGMGGAPSVQPGPAPNPGGSVQQFAFNTPYASPDEAACGRVAYSGFHVAPGSDGGFTPFAGAVFPEHCSGDLTPQEKVLLFMLFDLGACVGDPPEPPVCEPIMCLDVEAECGLINDGCGAAVDCGPCPPGEVCGLIEPNKCAACEPRTCEEAGVECGMVGDGCGGTLDCQCPEGLECGFAAPNKCGAPGDSR